jgi:uncharacterized protein
MKININIDVTQDMAKQLVEVLNKAAKDTPRIDDAYNLRIMAIQIAINSVEKHVEGNRIPYCAGDDVCTLPVPFHP